MADAFIELNERSRHGQAKPIWVRATSVVAFRESGEGSSYVFLLGGRGSDTLTPWRLEVHEDVPELLRLLNRPE